ncbi:hypothetical protein RJ640_030803 [Escallonia rubra]|uniref:Urease alpha-subunit N-terminal domain-containing protein n=1 Tax=Escallonia rubra TaxID=112253 RepID=A0AA88UQ17_9ASTE|nr:hypothetical protein RJ640_030803 [Escallonia rubra]
MASLMMPISHRSALEAVHTRRLGNAEMKNSSKGVIEEGSAICTTIYRESYANITNMYGPTAGDKIRLGDTEQVAEIERDFAVYGDECASGGIFEADIGIKGGGIVSLGKAGNPDIINGVLCDVIIGLSRMFHSSNSGRDMSTHKASAI